MTSRNASVDIAKMLAAIFVVGVHTRVFADVSGPVDFVFCDILFRTAVPFFAVCTGFFLTKKLTKEGMKSWTPVKSAAIKSLFLYVNWSLFFLLLLTYIWYKSGILTTSSFIGWFKSFLIGESYYHLWYLAQLFWALLVFFPILKFLPVKSQIVLTILLWIFGVYADIYFDLIGTGSNIVNLYNRFGSVTGSMGRLLPLMLAGSFLARRPAIPPRKSWLLTCLVFMLLVGEVLIIKGLGGIRFKYELLSLPLAYYLFSSICQTTVKCSFDSRSLAKASLYVYVIHPAILYFLREIGVESHLALFLLVTVLSVLISIAIVSVQQKIPVERC